MTQSQAQAKAASPHPTAPAGAETVSAPLPSPIASPAPKHPPVPMPSLKPGEVITWVKLDQPRLPLGEIIFSSLALVGLIVMMALAVGMCIGYLRSKRTDAVGAGSLRLR